MKGADASLTPLFILGPTGSGKSAVAVALAELLGEAEIVSADAYQVYRGLPIITAAPTAEEQARVPHHLVGFMHPAENNDAALHARRAQECIRAIQARGKRPVITGGSGLYVKFISHGISPAPPSDPALRAELTALPAAECVRRLQEADPEGARMTNLQNPRYVVRNLEIVLLGKKPLSAWKNNWQEAAGPGFVITRETAELDARIARRSEQMLREGAAEELAALNRSLAAEGCSLSATAAKTLGLAQVQALLDGRAERAAVVADIALTTRQYAKRQRTWLRREQWVTALQAGAKDTPARLAAAIAAQL